LSSEIAIRSPRSEITLYCKNNQKQAKTTKSKQTHRESNHKANTKQPSGWLAGRLGVGARCGSPLLYRYNTATIPLLSHYYQPTKNPQQIPPYIPQHIPQRIPPHNTQHIPHNIYHKSNQNQPTKTTRNQQQV
jgi:hypothetical protein